MRILLPTPPASVSMINHKAAKVKRELEKRAETGRSAYGAAMNTNLKLKGKRGFLSEKAWQRTSWGEDVRGRLYQSSKAET